jgi:hypothetical protein
MNPLTEKVTKYLRRCGLRFEVCHELYDPDNFGNAIVICKAGTLLLRFTRDRSQDVLELASIKTPNRFYFFGDIEIGMGWKSIDEFIELEDVPPLEDAVIRLAENFVELSTAVSGDPSRFVRARLERGMRKGILPMQGGLH